MVYSVTDDGLDFFAEVVTNSSFTDVIDTIAVGDGVSNPSTTDQSMQNKLYSADTSSSNIEVKRGQSTGVIVFDITVSGGTEVPAGSDITELGFKSTSGDLLYRELRSNAETVNAGQTKTFEIIYTVLDEVPGETNTVITDVGREYIADCSIGNSNEIINTIAVGVSNTSVSSGNTAMYNEIYRDTDTANNITLETTSNVGEIDTKVSITADGAQASAGDEISEFGILTDNSTLVMHETRNTNVTLQSGDTKAFDIPFNMVR